MKYTINEFRNDYPNDDVCLDTIFKLRFAKMPCCPQCSQQTTFKRIPGRRCYQCSDKDCQYQLYPTAGTVFEKTRTSLVDWFYAIYLMTSTRNGVSAKEIQRQLGVTYKCAWRMGHQIRLLMVDGSVDLMKGIVEVDETYIGGVTKNKSNKKRKELAATGAQFFSKTAVFTILERDGRIFTKVLDTSKPSASDLTPLIKQNVSADAEVITDTATPYASLKKDFTHEAVNHTQNEFLRSGYIHTNTVEGFFSQVKRTLKGTHIHVSDGHLQKYLNECSFRYVHRHQGQQMFFSILGQIVS